MMRRHYRSRRSRKPGMLRSFLPSLLMIVFGAGGFYGALQWFRSDAAPSHAMTVDAVVDDGAGDDDASTAIVATPATAPEQVAQAQVATVPLLSNFDGQSTGKIDRYVLGQGYEFYVLAYLPALDTNVESYHVWLLKDGLADVRDMGELTVRADGSWVSHVVADTLHGISDPGTYSSVVIMRQAIDADASSLGRKIATAKF